MVTPTPTDDSLHIDWLRAQLARVEEELVRLRSQATQIQNQVSGKESVVEAMTKTIAALSPTSERPVFYLSGGSSYMERGRFNVPSSAAGLLAKNGHVEVRLKDRAGTTHQATIGTIRRYDSRGGLPVIQVGGLFRDYAKTMHEGERIRVEVIGPHEVSLSIVPQDWKELLGVQARG